MRRWIALGLGAAGIAWGPYLYSELTRKPTELGAAQPAAAELALESPPPSAAAPPRENQLSAATAPELAAKPPRFPPAPEPATKPAHVPTQAPETATAANDTADDTETPAAVPELPSELAPAFRRAFEAEPRDAFWAVDEEPRLAGLLHGIGVPDSSVAEVACRKTVCRVAFSSLELEADVQSKLYARMHDDFDRAHALDHHAQQEHARVSKASACTGPFIKSPSARYTRLCCSMRLWPSKPASTISAR
jgi:hypothetical protein